MSPPNCSNPFSQPKNGASIISPLNQYFNAPIISVNIGTRVPSRAAFAVPTAHSSTVTTGLPVPSPISAASMPAITSDFDGIAAKFRAQSEKARAEESLLSSPYTQPHTPTSVQTAEPPEVRKSGRIRRSTNKDALDVQSSPQRAANKRPATSQPAGEGRATKTARRTPAATPTRDGPKNTKSFKTKLRIFRTADGKEHLEARKQEVPEEEDEFRLEFEKREKVWARNGAKNRVVNGPAFLEVPPVDPKAISNRYVRWKEVKLKAQDEWQDDTVVKVPMCVRKAEDYVCGKRRKKAPKPAPQAEPAPRRTGGRDAFPNKDIGPWDDKFGYPLQDWEDFLDQKLKKVAENMELVDSEDDEATQPDEERSLWDAKFGSSLQDWEDFLAQELKEVTERMKPVDLKVDEEAQPADSEDDDATQPDDSRSDDETESAHSNDDEEIARPDFEPVEPAEPAISPAQTRHKTRPNVPATMKMPKFSFASA